MLKGFDRPTLLLLLLFVPVGGAGAQAIPAQLSSRRQPLQVSVGAYYQDYEVDEGAVSEWSVPVFVFVPAGRSLGLSLRASQAAASADTLETLSGQSDVQLGLSYARRLGSSSLVFSLGVNLPSGKKELTQEEFATTVPLSFDFYDFQVPGLGQGLGASSGVTLAFPLGRDVVAGIGASYFYRGSFEPLQDMVESFDPGDEVLVTGGLDLRLGRRTSVSGDIIYTIYQTDRVGDNEVYGAGDKTAATVQLRHYWGFNELRLLGRYRSRAKSALLADSVLVNAAERTLPNQFEARATYRFRLSQAFSASLLATVRLFEETSVFTEKKAYDVGLLPVVRLTGSLHLNGRFVYTTGDVKGFEAGGGLMVQL